MINHEYLSIEREGQIFDSIKWVSWGNIFSIRTFQQNKKAHVFSFILNEIRDRIETLIKTIIEAKWGASFFVFGAGFNK